MREVFISDVHFGEDEDRRAWAFTLDILKDIQPDLVFLGGDIVDCGPLSSYTKEPDKAGAFQEELDHAFSQLLELRTALPRVEIMYLLGNHEDRLRRMILNHAPGLFGLRNLGWDHILNLDELQIQLLPEGEPYKIGHLNHLHGHELKGGGQVSPAHMQLQKINDSVIMGHFHQFSVAHKTGLSGKYYIGLSNGCLSTLKPDYVFNPKWRQGITVLDYAKSGLFAYQQVIYWEKGKHLLTFVDGKYYTTKKEKK